MNSRKSIKTIMPKIDEKNKATTINSINEYAKRNNEEFLFCKFNQ